MDSTPRFVILDRDGVLNRDRPDSVRSVDDFEMLPGAAAAVARLNTAGYHVVVATNQACVGRGELTLVELERIHLRLLQAVADAGGWIESIYVCPHAPDHGCACRKPAPGLVHRAIEEHDLEPAATWLVGDARRDVEAARAAGCRPAVVLTGKGRSIGPLDGVPVFDDLAAFAAWLVESDRES